MLCNFIEVFDPVVCTNRALPSSYIVVSLEVFFDAGANAQPQRD